MKKKIFNFRSIEKINSYIKYSFLISLPFIIGFLVLANFLISFFFGYGKFSLVDVELTAEVTKYYALSLAFMFIWPILYRAYQVLNWLKPVFLVLIGILANGFLIIFLSLFIILV